MSCRCIRPDQNFLLHSPGVKFKPQPLTCQRCSWRIVAAQPAVGTALAGRDKQGPVPLAAETSLASVRPIGAAVDVVILQRRIKHGFQGELLGSKARRGGVNLTSSIPAHSLVFPLRIPSHRTTPYSTMPELDSTSTMDPTSRGT